MSKIATLGAGCFWCIEACFKDINGIEAVQPGYMGGDASRATYYDVCKGDTGHAEIARITYDDNVVSYAEILKMFWFIHDPTQINRQGNDIGSHYRSIIFFHDNGQQEIAKAQIELLTKEEVWEKPIVTEVVPVQEFYAAESYHKDYLEKNPDNMYCQSVVRPKVDKFKLVFEKMLK